MVVAYMDPAEIEALVEAMLIYVIEAFLRDQDNDIVEADVERFYPWPVFEDDEQIVTTALSDEMDEDILRRMEDEYGEKYYVLAINLVEWAPHFPKKINQLNLRSTLVLAFLWFKFYRSTLESCFCVDFRFYLFSVIIFWC